MTYRSQEKQHLLQAWHNFILCKNLNNKDLNNWKVKNYDDWVVTICFYSAIHFVNAWFSKNNKNVKEFKEEYNKKT